MGQFKIAICTKRDIHGLVIVRQLLPLLRGFEARVFCSVKTRPDEELEPNLKLLKSLERDIAIDALAPLATPALDHGHVPAEWTPLENLYPNDGGGILAAFEPDVVISIRFSLIFKPWLLERVRLGIINIHPGPLPAYRGLFTPFWQMMNREATLGCTVHWVDQGIDTGPILGFGVLPRDPERSLLWHIPHIYLSGLATIVHTVQALRVGDVVRSRAQSQYEGNYYRFPKALDFARFRQEAGDLATARDYADLLGLAYRSGTAP